jgi:hypothetical protein
MRKPTRVRVYRHAHEHRLRPEDLRSDIQIFQLIPRDLQEALPRDRVDLRVRFILGQFAGELGMCGGSHTVYDLFLLFVLCLTRVGLLL